MASATTDSLVSDHLTWVWDMQSQWSQSADRIRQSVVRARNASLALTILAAVTSAFAASLEKDWEVHSFRPVSALLFTAGLSMGVVTLLQTATRRERVESWSRARSVSEALKAEVFTFLAGVSPYRDGDRAALFKKNIDRILAEADDVNDMTDGLKPERRPLPAVNNVDSYVVHRVQQQIDTFYRPKSAAMKRRSARYRLVEIALAVIAVVLSAATAWGEPRFAAWTGVVTTIIATTTAHAAVQRYDALALEYARTYKQLERLLRNRSGDPATQSAATDDQFVAAAEGVLAVQNQAWMTRNIATADHGRSKP